MTARQARFARRVNVMRRLYCGADGTKPGPHPTMDFVLRRYYREVGHAMRNLPSPLLRALRPLVNSGRYL